MRRLSRRDAVEPSYFIVKRVYCTIATWRIDVPHQAVFRFLRRNEKFPRVEILFSSLGTIRGKGIRERIAGK